MEKSEMGAERTEGVAGTESGAASSAPGAGDGASPAAKDRIHELTDRLREVEADHQKEREGLMGHIYRLEGRMEEIGRRPASAPEAAPEFDSVEDELRFELRQVRQKTEAIDRDRTEQKEREAFARKLHAAIGVKKFGEFDEDARRLVEIKLRETGDERQAAAEAERLAKRWGGIPASVSTTPSPPKDAREYADAKLKDGHATRAPAPAATAAPGGGKKGEDKRSSKEMFADAEYRLLAALSGSQAGE